MAVSQTIIEDTYSAIEGARAPAGLLSDGYIVVVVRKANGSNWDYEIHFSDDGGSTWSMELGFLSNANANLYTRLVGDKIYCVLGTSAVNTALTFYRVDYTSATKSFSLAVNGATIRSAISDEFWGVPGMDKESVSGRLWCSYIYGTSAGNRLLSASYSDNDGSSWNTTTLALSPGVTSPHAGVACLEYKTIVTIGGVSAGNYQIFYATRNHSDGTNVWSGNLSQAIDTTDGVTPYSYLSKESASPSKRALVVAWDQASGTAQKLYGRRFVEDGAGNLTLYDPQTVTCPEGEGGFIWPSGRTDGFEVFYMYSGSMGTVRIRRYANGDSNWQSESTLTLSPSARGYSSCAPPYEMACAMGAKLLLINGTGTAGSYRPYAVRENLGPASVLVAVPSVVTVYPVSMVM